MQSNIGLKCTLFSQAHSSVEKAGLIGLVKLRFLSSDENLSLRGDKLQEAITADRKSGYIPFFVSLIPRKAR